MVSFFLYWCSLFLLLLHCTVKSIVSNLITDCNLNETLQSSDTCNILCNNNDNQPLIHTVYCRNAGRCIIQCSSTLCMKNSTIYAQHVESLEITSSAIQCLSHSTIYLPNNGNVTINANSADSSFSDCTIYSGSSTDSIYINCNGYNNAAHSIPDICNDLTLNTSTANKLQLIVQQTDANRASIQCPINSCIINATQGIISMQNTTIIAPHETETVDLYIGDKTDFTHSILKCQNGITSYNPSNQFNHGRCFNSITINVPDITTSLSLSSVTQNSYITDNSNTSDMATDDDIFMRLGWILYVGIIVVVMLCLCVFIICGVWYKRYRVNKISEDVRKGTVDIEKCKEESVSSDGKLTRTSGKHTESTQIYTNMNKKNSSPQINSITDELDDAIDLEPIDLNLDLGIDINLDDDDEDEFKNGNNMNHSIGFSTHSRYSTNNSSIPFNINPNKSKTPIIIVDDGRSFNKECKKKAKKNPFANILKFKRKKSKVKERIFDEEDLVIEMEEDNNNQKQNEEEQEEQIQEEEKKEMEMDKQMDIENRIANKMRNEQQMEDQRKLSVGSNGSKLSEADDLSEDEYDGKSMMNKFEGIITNNIPNDAHLRRNLSGITVNTNAFSEGRRRDESQDLMSEASTFTIKSINAFSPNGGSIDFNAFKTPQGTMDIIQYDEKHEEDEEYEEKTNEYDIEMNVTTTTITGGGNMKLPKKITQGSFL